MNLCVCVWRGRGDCGAPRPLRHRFRLLSVQYFGPTFSSGHMGRWGGGWSEEGAVGGGEEGGVWTGGRGAKHAGSGRGAGRPDIAVRERAERDVAFLRLRAALNSPAGAGAASRLTPAASLRTHPRLCFPRRGHRGLVSPGVAAPPPPSAPGELRALFARSSTQATLSKTRIRSRARLPSTLPKGLLPNSE